MSDAPKVSVIIPAFNCEDTIGSTINSVLVQDLADFEILVCDDASGDHTWENLSECSDPRLRALRNDTNAGVSATRNRLIREARGQYIAFLDGDDRFLPQKLSRCVAELERTGCVGISHEMKYLAHDGSLKGRISAKVIFPSALMVRTDIVNAAGLFREDLSVGEDTDFLCRIRALGEIRAIPEPLTAYRLVANSETDRGWFDKRLIEHWYTENRNTPLPPGKLAHREWFRQKPMFERIRLTTAWYGQRRGRKAAAHYLNNRYFPAAWNTILSLALNPSYLFGRLRRML